MRQLRQYLRKSSFLEEKKLHDLRSFKTRDELSKRGLHIDAKRVSRICLKKVSGWQEARLKRHRKF
jgi:hypothetical protein